jgi:hypothetical protein
MEWYRWLTVMVVLVRVPVPHLLGLNSCNI